MEVKFHIARHTWKEGETAGWSDSDFPLDVRNAIEKDYHRLVHERCKHQVYKARSIFLIYDDKKDVTNRPITEITAVCSDTYVGYSKEVYDDLEKTVRAFDGDCASVKLNIKISLLGRIKNQGILSKQKKKSKLYKLSTAAMMLVFSALILVIVIKVNFRKQNFDDMTPKVKQSEIEANLMTEYEKKRPSDASDGIVVKAFCGKYQILKYKPTKVSIIDKYSDKCIGIYIDHRCSGQLKKLSYRNWVNQKHNNGSVPGQCQYPEADEEVTDFISAFSSENHFEGIVLRRFFNGK